MCSSPVDSPPSVFWESDTFPSIRNFRCMHHSYQFLDSSASSRVLSLVLISWSRTRDIREDHTSVPSESSVSIILQSCHVHVRNVILLDDQSERSLFSTLSASVIFSCKTASNDRLGVDDFISQSVDLSSSWNEIVPLPIWLESPLSSCLSSSHQDPQGTKNSVREIFDLKKIVHDVDELERSIYWERLTKERIVNSTIWMDHTLLNLSSVFHDVIYDFSRT